MKHFHHRRRIARRSWLQFESMEPRNLLAVYNVQLNAAPGGDGSAARPFATIAAAVSAAITNSGPDEILVGPGSYAESISISDPADLTIRGDAAQRPVLRGIGLVLPNANYVFENFDIVSPTGSGIFVDNANRPFVRAGSISLNNMNIQVSASGNSWNNVSINGLNQFTATNIVLTNGRVLLNDVNTATLSQITVNQSRTNALSANFVSQLIVNGLTSVQPFASGIVLTNPTRTYSGIGTRPVNEQSVVSLSGVQITASGASGLDAGTNISLTVLNSAFNSNLNFGASLSFVTSTVMENVQTNSNSTGIFLSREGTFSGRFLVSRLNRVTGFNAATIGSVSIEGADFSNNTTHGFALDSISGPVNLRTIRANSNGQWGGLLNNIATNVSLADITTNSNGRVGLTLFRSSANTVFSNVIFNGGQSIGNSQAGIELIGLATLNMNNVTATDNGGFGLLVSQATGAVLIANSQFHRNSSVTTTTVRAGTNLTGLKSGLTLTNVSANDNPIDGIIVDNALGSITASGISASGNPFTGLYVNNATQSRQAALTLSDSNLSGNGKNGLLAVSQSRVSISRSHFDNNGPLANQSVDIGTGAWISNTGSGGVSIEDSTAIGTRVGVQSGAGIQVVNASGPEVQVRRVTITDTLVHPLTTTNFGAGLVVLGTVVGARVEDSTFSRNSLLDSIAARAVIFTGVPLTVVRSQFLDNAGVAIQTTQTLSLQDSTVARTTGTGISIGSSGTILRSTISGNSPSVIVATGSLLIDESTLTGNATIPTVAAPPMVIQNTSSLTLHNSIVAGNGPDSWAFSNPALTASTGFNLLSGTPVGWVGLATDIVGDLNNRINPVLSVLENFGGPTLTHMPLAGSPALETGDAALNGARDQRGQLRPLSLDGRTTALPDIGAVEASDVSLAPAIMLNSSSAAGTEGSVLTLRGRVTDFDGNLANLTAGLGSVQLNADGTFVWTYTAIDDLSTTVQLTATDALGGVGSASFSVVVSNVAPVLGTTNTFANDLRTVTLQTSVSDLGLLDTHLFTIQWGDGTTSTVAPDANRRLTAIHQYASVDSYVLSVFATDDDGARTAAVSRVVNVAPTIVLNANSVTGYEGARLQVTGRINDPDGISNRISTTLGSVTLSPDGSFVWTLIPADNTSTNVVLTATDVFGATASTSFALSVANVAPTLGSLSATTNAATRIVNLQSSVFDLGTADTHEFTILWGDGTSSVVAAAADRTLAASHQYAAVGPITIAVYATDDDGAGTQTSTITINVAPTIQLDLPSVTGREGDLLTLTGLASDPDGNLSTLTASLGAIQLNADGTFVWTFVPPDNLDTNVVLTATDAFGAAATASFTVKVNNLAPVLGTTSSTLNVATRTVTLRSSVTDAGTADTHVFTIQWGDGTSSIVAPSGSGSLVATHQYSLLGPMTISVAARDDDGASSLTATVGQVIPGFALRNRELFVYGSSQNDSISFNVQKRQSVIAIANFAGFATQFSFDKAMVDNVVGKLDDGNDIWAGANLAKPQFIFGEAGNDQITTGESDDIVVGGAGVDVLTANSGRDLLFGGLGADRLFGQDRSDVLVAGKFESENDLVALRMLRAAWLPSNLNYQTRVNRLRAGVGTDALGNTVRLSIDLITDDAVDQLYGGKDSDWFLTNIASEIIDSSGGESRN